FPDEAEQSHIVLEILIRIVDNFSAVLFFEELRVNSLLCRLELAPDVILLANENQLPRRRVVLVLKRVMHSKPEIFQTEFAEILATDCERIEIVFLQISPKFATALLVFPPNESSGEKQQRDNDGGDYVDAKLVLQNFDHMRGLNSVAQFSRTRSFAGWKLRQPFTDFQSGWKD